MNPAPSAGRFKPPIYLRDPMLQTFLGSNRLRRPSYGSMLASARPLTLLAEEGVRLAGSLSRVNAARSRGLAILLHGWEGSIASTYMLTTAQALYRHGFNVFRLNLRDHGATHHLNRGLFFATRLDEVYAAVMDAARLAKGGPVFLGGFSLGGNFALRIARRWSQAPTADIDLRHVIAISPVLDPSLATDAIDGHPAIRRYFLRKWQRSLMTKQHCFPQDYDFSDVMALDTIRQMTERLLGRYSHYPGAEAYFAGYNLCDDALQTLCIPTSIVTAADDPIIPVADFYRLAPHPQMHLVIQPYGGHNGFIMDWRGRAWYEGYMQHAFGSALSSADLGIQAPVDAPICSPERR